MTDTVNISINNLIETLSFNYKGKESLERLEKEVTNILIKAVKAAELTPESAAKKENETTYKLTLEDGISKQLSAQKKAIKAYEKKLKKELAKIKRK